MICIYTLAKQIYKIVDNSQNLKQKNIDFFLNSMSDETYLNMIKDHIEFLVDEGYKYSEQLEIINKKANRTIKYATYKQFIKTKILNIPIIENINNEPKEHFFDYSAIKEEVNTQSYSNINKQNNLEETQTIKNSVPPIKKNTIKKSLKRENISFQHEAVPNIDELY